jgi:hypothetical protein
LIKAVEFRAGNQAGVKKGKKGSIAPAVRSLSHFVPGTRIEPLQPTKGRLISHSRLLSRKTNVTSVQQRMLMVVK